MNGASYRLKHSQMRGVCVLLPRDSIRRGSGANPYLVAATDRTLTAWAATREMGDAIRKKLEKAVYRRPLRAQAAFAPRPRLSAAMIMPVSITSPKML